MHAVSRRTALSMAGAAIASASAAPCLGAVRRKFTFQSASDFARALKRRELSATEALNEAITRIERLDTLINAVVVRDFERARVAAAEADRAIAAGEWRPLLGVPMTVKESFNIAGLATTSGVPENRNHIAAKDSDEVARLRAAGAVILGKTNVPFRLADWQTYNEIYGVTRNPWNVDRSPGGSSGGAAAALAAGYVPLELGSDLAGSIRVPANFCGVYGHKTTAPGAPGTGPLAVAGPMSRTAADLSSTLEILFGGNTFLPARHRRLKDFRVLLLTAHPLLPTSSIVVDALEKRADALTRKGVKVRRSSTLLPDLVSSGHMYSQLLDVIRNPSSAARVRPECYTEAAIRTARAQVAAQWQALFKAFDVVLCPVMPTTAFPHDHTPGRQNRKLIVEGRTVPYLDQELWSGVATFPGLPSTAVPLEIDAEGLPTGAQVIGSFREDHTTIAFARRMEESFGGFQSGYLPSAFRN